MNAQQLVLHIRESFHAPWLADAAAKVDAQMARDGGHDFGHLARVYNNARQILRREDETADLGVIVAAVLFHDIVNLPKNHPERRSASARSAQKARAWFAEHGFEEDRLELLAEAILCHSWSAGYTPVSLEARIVADADNLEAIGAFGIARTFYVSGHMGSAIVDMADPFGERRELDDTQFARDHFPRKLLKLREQMHTAGGRELAAQRHEFMVAFLAQLDDELGL